MRSPFMRTFCQDAVLYKSRRYGLRRLYVGRSTLTGAGLSQETTPDPNPGLPHPRTTWPVEHDGLSAMRFDEIKLRG